MKVFLFGRTFAIRFHTRADNANYLTTLAVTVRQVHLLL